MAGIVQREFGMKATGSTTHVPDDDFSKLQYYISCVNNLLPGLDIPYELRNYQGSTINAKVAEAVIAMAYLISPDELSGKVLFPVPAGHRMLNGSANEFYDVSLATTFVAATDRIVIGGRNVNVSKIMLCQISWLDKNWGNPMKRIVAKMQQPQRRQPAIAYRQAPAQPASYRPPARSYQYRPPPKSKSGCIIA
eukprot:TRINITY_DN24079_c0_g1_i1.p2 TRINITY_DN24079_c0_g1~~TRINITY_DN24079_c0_g1_i1.p2  ORF type:complete len:194 (+),score=55.67 TRINITY_DN24079_c0_g1_i1:1360-1941(+)